ncbi:MAG TPA: sigma 54-interacting transcriptional regulator [Polyangiaceae bacterium]|nr:sigma 54-interacting transcriptional regulator [Polyangiaceae bacterium]
MTSGPEAGAPDGRPPRTQVMMAHGVEVRRIEKLRVTVVDGPDLRKRGRAFTFARDEIRVGANPELDLPIEDRSVSREHLFIRAGELGWTLVDTGSTNGTYIGELRVHRGEVYQTTLVRIGQTVLRIEPMGEHVEQELSSHNRFGRMIGQSPSMREMFAVLEKVARSDLTVLIEGETGTGKELAAEGLHEASARQGMFITLNCGAIPRELIESELMGHVKGAFTGAVSDRPGALVAANGGTLFLDEVGELPIDMQAKLLRVLERREVKPVGADYTTPVDVRVVAATNRNLAHDAENGRFRQDLYFRLAVVVVRIPPLRSRIEDLGLLVDHIQGELNRRRAAAGQGAHPPLDDTALGMLRRYEFPGNVRELRNIVERWVVLGAHTAPGSPAVRSGVTNQGSLAGPGAAEVDNSLLSLPYHEAKEAWIERFERAYVEGALDRANGNVSQASRDAQVDRRHLQRLMSRYDIRR